MRITREWLDGLTLRQQACLLSAIRGCDGAPKEDASKSVLWALRWDVLHPSGGPDQSPYTTQGFMGYRPALNEDRDRFLDSLDHYPLHFVTHLMHAAQILGYKHPEIDKAEWWRGLYTDIVSALHLIPETEQRMDIRLRDR